MRKQTAFDKILILDFYQDRTIFSLTFSTRVFCVESFIGKFSYFDDIE